MVTCMFSLLLGFKLQRICSNRRLEQGRKTRKVESALRHCKLQTLKRLLTDDMVDVDEAVNHILQLNTSSSDTDTSFSTNLALCLSQICGYRQLVIEVEALRKVPYSSENRQHEALLLSLWSRLRPGVPLRRRFSRQWTEIGFQGDDPMTDFRGMGLLGLHNLWYLATHYPDTAGYLLARSGDKQYGYSFAIVGINLTGMAYSLLTAGHLKSHFYNTVKDRPTLDHFHDVFVHLMYEFDRFWLAERPSDIMQFNAVKDRFHKNIIQTLQSKTSLLTFQFKFERDTIERVVFV